MSSSSSESLPSSTTATKAFVHVATLECAVNNLCIPCMYKICPTGSTTEVLRTTSTVTLPPNVRPEMCPRAKSIDTRLYRGLYTDPPAMSRILTVGDGDLSFSLSIAKYYYDMFGSAKNVLATTHESYDSVCTTYQDGKKHIDLLTRLGARVFHQVDATNLASTLPVSFTSQALVDKQFHFVLWNFPCIRVEKGADGQVSELEQNQQLIRSFFANIQPFLVPAVGEVHLAHKTIEPFSWWGIKDLAMEKGFNCERTIVFDRCNYPGYINRKVLDKKSFPCNDALVYVFSPFGEQSAERDSDSKKKKSKKDKKDKRSKKDKDDDISSSVIDIQTSANVDTSGVRVCCYMDSLACLENATVQERLHAAIERLLLEGSNKKVQKQAVQSVMEKKSFSSEGGRKSSIKSSNGVHNSAKPVLFGQYNEDNQRKRKYFDDEET